MILLHQASLYAFVPCSWVLVEYPKMLKMLSHHWAVVVVREVVQSTTVGVGLGARVGLGVRPDTTALGVGAGGPIATDGMVTLVDTSTATKAKPARTGIQLRKRPANALSTPVTAMAAATAASPPLVTVPVM